MRPSPLAAIDHSHGAQPDPAALASALRAQQVRMHGDNVPWATAGALVLALLFVGVQWRAIAHGPLLGWLAALLLVLAWRAGLWVWQRRQGADTGTHRPGDATWLRLYRANFLAHGLVWAAASALPMPAHEPMQLALLVMMLAGIATSNFILNAFDLAAALLFGVPAIGALALRLLLDSDGVQQLMGLAVLLALGFFVLTGRRTHRMVRENSALRLAEAHHNHLLRVLIESTSEGFWFIDTQAVTVDANPAMCQLLGLPRAALVGRSIYDFVDAENRAIFERELVPRISGAGSGYEITLRRADGSLVDCFNQATPILDPQGRRVGSVGLWTDISVRKRAERALQETSEALRQKSQALEDTLASIGQGIVSYDGQGRLRAHNRRLLELLDMPAALFQPQSTYVDLAAYLTARGDLRPGQALLDASGQPLPPLASPEHLPDLYVRRTPAGLLLEVRTLRLADGGMVRTFSDVTAYIQALRSLAAREREQRDLLEAFPGYIAVTDQAYRYGYVNQRFASLVGRPREQIIDRPATEVLGEGRFAQMRTLLDRTRPGELVHTESDYPATAWRPRIDLQVTHAVSQDPATGARRVYAFAIDISARKAAETALVAARDEAERANRAKSQFLSSMSHELRTPLHAILGFGQLLATDKAHPLAPPQQAQMEEILRGANHLLHLINEVLDLAVVETGSLSVHLQPVALAPVLAEALALLRPLAGSRGITLPAAATGLAETAMVQADPVRLKQVLLNLLGNAIKYNQPQGQVRVHCEARALAGGTAGGAARNAGWRIVVQDTGLGLDAARQARLFSAFDRLGAEAGQVEGTGLGLALSRGLVRAMGGDIGVISQPGEGSSFWLQLPPAASGMLAAPLAGLAPPATPPPATRPTATAPASPAHPLVLYVEDNPVNRMLMEAVFDQLPGLQLRMACNAAQGLQMALEQPPQLVLLDIQLPDMDGHALLQLLRQQPQLRQLPVIAVSADALPDTIARGRGAGFTDYLAKPVDVEQLAAAVHAALGRR